MRRLKQTLSLVLALIMIGSVLTACGETNGTESDEVEEVEIAQINLTPDIEFIAQASKDFKVSFAVENGELADDISADDIYLTSSFKGMSAEVVSHSGNNLTLQLKGDIVPNEANAYQWGTVNVKASAFKDGEYDVASNVDIAFVNGAFDATTLKYNDGKITVNYITYASKADELSEDNIKIEGVTVEKVEKVDDNTVKLTLSADGVKDANGFADFVSDKEIEVNGLTSDIELSQASFYPVFDYVEENGDDLEFTLKLYVYNGSVDKELKSDAISFADGFADAKVVSVTVDEDTAATVILSVPANDAAAEDIDINGTVTLAAGSLINKWGDKTSVERTHTRNYSNETLGRDKIASDDWVVLGSTNATLNGDTLLQIQKYTRGLNTTFGKICYYAGIAAKVYSIGKTILEATGTLQSDQDKIMEQFSILSSKLDSVLENQYKIMDMLNTIDYHVVEAANDTYRQNLDDLKADVELQEKLFWLGAMYIALEDAIAEGKLDKMPRQTDFDKYKYLLPNVDNMTDDELEAYNNRLVDYMTKRSEDSTDPVFNDFLKSYESMQKELGHVADKIAKTDATNPITRFDTLCSMKYNFSSQCYGFRFAQRATASDLLSRGMMIIFAHEKVMTYPEEATFIGYQKRVEKAATWLDESYESIGHTASEVAEDYCAFSYVLGSYVYLKDSKAISSYDGFNGALIEGSKYRNWSDDEKRTFVGRLQTNSITEDMNAAGFDISDAFLLAINSEKHHTISYGRDDNLEALYYIYNGEVLEPDKNTTSSAKLGKSYEYNEMGDATKEKYKDVTYLVLTDSDRNPEATVIDPDKMRIAYQAHVQDMGWQEPVISDRSDWNKTAGTTGKSKRMEALRIFLVDEDGNSMVQYRAYVQDKGWQNWVDSSTDKYAGTTGQGKRMEALEIKLKPEYTDKYMIYYRVYVQDSGWTDWVTNGSTAGTTGKSKRIEAVEIGLQKAPTIISEWQPPV